MTEKFLCVIRGFHRYKDIWFPEVGDEFQTKHESTNQYDSNAISVVVEEDPIYDLDYLKRFLIARINNESLPTVLTKVGYLPREVSAECCKFIKSGGKITGVVTDRVRNGKGLEIPCELTFEHSNEQLVTSVFESISKMYTYTPKVQSSPKRCRIGLKRKCIASNNYSSGPVYETFGSRVTANASNSNNELATTSTTTTSTTTSTTKEGGNEHACNNTSCELKKPCLLESPGKDPSLTRLIKIKDEN